MCVRGIYGTGISIKEACESGSVSVAFSWANFAVSG